MRRQGRTNAGARWRTAAIVPRLSPTAPAARGQGVQDSGADNQSCASWIVSRRARGRSTALGRKSLRGLSGWRPPCSTDNLHDPCRNLLSSRATSVAYDGHCRSASPLLRGLPPRRPTAWATRPHDPAADDPDSRERSIWRTSPHGRTDSPGPGGPTISATQRPVKATFSDPNALLR